MDTTTVAVDGADSDDDQATVVERRVPFDSMESGETIGQASTLPGTASGESIAATVGRSPSALSSPSFAVRTSDLATRTLLSDELLRSRSLAQVGVVLGLIVGAIIPFIGGDAKTTAIVLGACGVSVAANVVLLFLCRDPNRFRSGPLAAVWLSAALAIGVGICFFGVFSPAPVIAGLGVYFVALGNMRWLAYAVWLVIAGTIGLVSIISMAGVIDDPGLITGDALPIKHRALLQALLQSVLFGVFVLGRHSRQGTAVAVAELERTTRELAQREALLDEARLELRAALAAGGAGPWSGRELSGYVIGALIGRGGMGEVYEAIGPDDARMAIKLLTPAAALDAKIVERFRREAEITAALVSENIVRVFAVSEPGSVVPYLVMERLSGRDLAALLRKHVALAQKELIRLVEQVAAGLDAAHAAGVVHRDIKPQNLFADESSGARTWKILDFGVSKLGEHSGTLTQGNIVGTPAYMAPEQAKGADDVGPPADAYALASIAYRCLTGRAPFRGKTTAALLYNVVHEMPVRPSSFVRASSAVDAALALGMAKDPTQRIQTAGEFAAVFLDALRDRLHPDVLARARRLAQTSTWNET